MSVETQVNPRLAALAAAGTAPWLDQIRRKLISSGELQRLIDEDSLRGVTSNPSIFEKAILGSSDYDEDLVAMAKEGMDAKAIYDAIAIKDVQLATDVLRPTWEQLGHADGFVSLEVQPELARETEGTLESARSYWSRVDRPNLFIKIPGTDEGVPAIEQAIYEGINVNVTLLFAVAAYDRVAEAYIRGLERRHEEGKSLDVHSVASFFVSRVDTEVDKRLGDAHPELHGTAALANARAAYRSFKGIFAGERWEKLAAAGAKVQRPLWASTGVKNPAYPETKYVDELVAPDTVNTMPMATLLAAASKAEITGATADQDPSEDLQKLADAGIDLDDVTRVLLDAGIEQFVKAMNDLIAGVEEQREAAVLGQPPTVQAHVPSEVEGALAQRVKAAVAEGVAQRVWRKDARLWGGPDKPEIENRLGWLTISEPMLEHLDDLLGFVDQVKADGYTDAVLLGMGGSSLGPEVLRRSFGEIEGALRLRVLDSTDPAEVLAVERSVDLDRTLFVVSSKSGSTIETLSHYRYFRSKLDDGAHFVAITDPGSPLANLGREHGFRRVFENDPDIGGRYSVLSYFGLVPAALMGIAVDALLHRAQVAEANCTSYDSTASNSGLWLGLAIGELARQGRDKATFVVGPPIDSFGLWVEQLIAESTGKEGRGVLPVAGEPLGSPDVYGDDRVFTYLRVPEHADEALDAKVRALADAGHPTFTVAVHGPIDLGRVFFFAEFAIAVAGWVLDINPFDQPNVQEAKDNTNKVLEAYARDRKLPDVAEADDDALRALLSDKGPPHYVAVLGYVPESPEFDAAVTELRELLRGKTGCAVTFGYGPRFQHSTGQYHKGGPKTGVFLQLVGADGEDVEIPEAGYTFGTLKNAAATGDLQTLRDHGLPAERVRLEGDPVAALRALTQKLEELL
ncbi:MAG: bifunctional transaldolase/phosoglucose isomerase [Solirubrobacteraceae bacterium]